VQRVTTSQRPAAGAPALRWAPYAIGALPIAIAACFAFLDPRPYFVAANDPEHDYYYGARLITAGYPVHSTHHPGTPIYYLASLLMRVVGTDLAATQTFFNVAYLTIGVLTALSLWLLARLLSPFYDRSVLVVAAATAIAWPSFLLHLNYYGADSFVVALGLVPVALFWRNLHAGTPSRSLLAASGFATGLCLATKMVFVPLAAALFVGSSLQLLRAAGVRRALPSLLVFPAAAAVGFLVFIAPVIERAVGILYLTIGRPGVVAGGSPGDWLRSAPTTLRRVFEADAPLVVLTVLVLAVLLVALVRAIRPRRARGYAQPRPRVLTAPGPFDHLAAGAFLLLLGASLAVTVLVSVNIRQDDLGFQLRYAAPGALVIPFLVLFTSRLLDDAEMGGPALARRRGALAGVTAVLVAGYAIGAHAVERHRSVEQMTAASRQHVLDVVQAAKPAREGRIALWDGSPGVSGEVSFHMWGNYRYASETFSAELLRQFPAWTTLRLRDVCKPTAVASGRSDGVGRKRTKYGAAGEWFWRTLMGRGPYKRRVDDGALFAGEAASERVALLAFRQAEWEAECPAAPIQKFAELSEPHVGPTDIEERDIFGQRWVFVRPRGDDVAPLIVRQQPSGQLAADDGRAPLAAPAPMQATVR
jgi:hypothetical protein